MTKKWRVFPDQNIRYEVTQLLTEQGIDVWHAYDVNLQRATAPEILQFAITENRILITRHKDFGDLNIFPLPESHPGVLRINVRLPIPAVIADMLISFLKTYSPADLANALVILTEKKIRIRRR